MKTRILFFIAGSAPTAAESAAAAKLGTSMLRNASQVVKGDTLERCDGVAGKVPEAYAAKFPVVDAPAPAPVPEVAAEPVAPEAPLVATQPNPPDFLPPAASDAAAVAEDPVAALRAAEDEGAKSATAAQLKASLVQLGIPFAPNTRKSELLALFLARPAAEPVAPSV